MRLQVHWIGEMSLKFNNQFRKSDNMDLKNKIKNQTMK